MKVFTDIYCTVEFAACHYWPEAPDEVAFLRTAHRHVFHVTLWKSVGELDRSIEFIMLKRELTAFVRQRYEEKTFKLSCEQIAAEIIKEFSGSACKVSEDGENGAQVTLVATCCDIMEI